jgi:hypothetical protein
MSQATICEAIRSRNLIQFFYSEGAAPGDRVVEPHMVAYNKKNVLALSAWYLSGTSGSQEGPGWREYLLESISNVVILPETFSAPRPTYNPTGGVVFHDVQCAL